jgi:serine/threonine-protein kinase RIO1
MLPEQVNKHTLADWKDSAATFVRQQLFDKKQFVTDKELMFGGTIQELVCTDINISDGKRAQIFWDERGGKETVRNTFRTKRQAAQNAMKLAFRGK